MVTNCTSMASTAPPMPQPPRFDWGKPNEAEEKWSKTSKAMLKELPNVNPNKSERWKLQPCPEGRRCGKVACDCYHCPIEKRCKDFLVGQCVKEDCKEIHLLDPTAIKEVFIIDLASDLQRFSRLKALENQTVQERATYVRVVGMGFCGVLSNFLRQILKLMPFVQELVLPDLHRDLNILVYLCDLVSDVLETPNLRTVVWMTGQTDELWEES